MKPPTGIRRLDAQARTRWDSFVQAATQGTFFHLSGWKEVIEQAFGHGCHYLYTERDGAITGVLPLVHVKSRLFANALVSNAFCVYGGPLATDSASAEALDRAAEDLGRSLGVDYIEYRMRDAGTRGWALNDSLYVTFRKEILPEPEANLLAIPRKQRAMVRKGIKADLVLERDLEVDRFFRLYAESVRNLGTPVYPKKFFSCIKSVFGESCEIALVSRDKETLSAVMSFVFRDEILPYYGGGSVKAREFAAYDFMYWQVMKTACERGLRTFDFGRSKRDTGSYAFKRHWGFEPVPLSYEYLLLRAKDLPEINPLNPKYHLAISVWKRLPLAVANTVGPFLSRALG